VRIAIDARMVRRPLSGPGRYAINLIRALANLDNENQYIIIQNINKPEKITEAENFKTIWVEYPPLSLRTVFWLQTLLEKEKVQIFHSLYFLTPIGGNFTRIITIHDLMALNFPNFFQGRPLPVKIYGKIFTNAFIRTSCACSSRIITDSETVRNQIIQWKPECSRRISVIYPGIDSSFGRINDMSRIENIRKKFGLAQNIILYIGNTRPYKNLPRLIKAFKLLNDNQEYKFQLVIGGGESRNLNALKLLTHNLEIEDFVVFTGELTDDEVITLMNMASIFVFPSLYEGFGLPPLEAMACGTPVVTANAGSLPEVVGDASLLINPESENDIYLAMKRLLINQQLRDTLIQKGFDRVKLFSWDKTAREILEVYKQVAKRED
jgi:glycosyltransferase involved in cell wall biosynthesis